MPFYCGLSASLARRRTLCSKPQCTVNTYMCMNFLLSFHSIRASLGWLLTFNNWFSVVRVIVTSSPFCILLCCLFDRSDNFRSRSSIRPNDVILALWLAMIGLTLITHVNNKCHYSYCCQASYRAFFLLRRQSKKTIGSTVSVKRTHYSCFKRSKSRIHLVRIPTKSNENSLTNDFSLSFAFELFGHSFAKISTMTVVCLDFFSRFALWFIHFSALSMEDISSHKYAEWHTHICLLLYFSIHYAMFDL